MIRKNSYENKEKRIILMTENRRKVMVFEQGAEAPA
jgi:hypothetical protein